MYASLLIIKVACGRWLRGWSEAPRVRKDRRQMGATTSRGLVVSDTHVLVFSLGLRCNHCALGGIRAHVAVSARYSSALLVRVQTVYVSPKVFISAVLVAHGPLNAPGNVLLDA